MRFETWLSRDNVSGVSLLHLWYLLTLMAYLCSKRTPNVQVKYFVFDWSIYNLFVLNRTWKRDSHQIMLFGYEVSTWCIIELKTRFEAWITRNAVNGVSLFHLPYVLTLMVYLCSQWTPNVQISFLCLIVRIQSICAKYILETWLSPNNDIRTCLHDMRNSWTKNAFWDVNSKK
jgi:hypothetical protein